MQRYFLALMVSLAFLSFSLPVHAVGPEGGLQAGQVLHGRFVQERHLQGFNAPLRSEGHFVLAAGRGLIWQAETPFVVTTAISPAGLAQDVGGSQTMRLPAARLPFLSRLYDMLGGALGGDWRALEQDFTVERSGDAKAWRVVLTPRKGPDPVTMPFQSITVRGGRFVDAVRITKPDGDYDDLAFLDQVLGNGPLTAQETQTLDAPGQ